VDLVFSEAFPRLKMDMIKAVFLGLVLGLCPLLAFKICLYSFGVFVPPFPVASIKDISPRRDLISRVYDRDFPDFLYVTFFAPPFNMFAIFSGKTWPAGDDDPG